jgi:hypothetical protein
MVKNSRNNRKNIRNDKVDNVHDKIVKTVGIKKKI